MRVVRGRRFLERGAGVEALRAALLAQRRDDLDELHRRPAAEDDGQGPAERVGER